jgi:hypothetical protein
MKKIILLQTQITNTQAPADFVLDYRREFLRLIEISPEGMTISQMDMAVKVARKLQDHGELEILLEDAEWEYLLGRLRAARFNLIAPEIIDMLRAVEGAPDAAFSQSTKKAGS